MVWSDDSVYLFTFQSASDMQSVHIFVLAFMATFASRSSEAATPCTSNFIGTSFFVGSTFTTTCQQESGYPLIFPNIKPTDAHINLMCASTACKTAVARALSLNPPDCLVNPGNYLFRTDFLNLVSNCVAPTPTPSVTTPTPTPTVTPAPATSEPSTPPPSTETTPMPPQLPSAPTQTPEIPSTSSPSPTPTPDASGNPSQSPSGPTASSPTTERPLCGKN